MFSSKSATEHSARKRLISHVYSKSFIQSSEPAREQAREILYNRLIPALYNEGAVTIQGQTGNGVDIYSMYMATSMDFIVAYVFGLRHGTNILKMKNYREHLLEMYKARNDYAFFDQEMPWLTEICRKVGIPLCPKFVDDANDELHDWIKELCRGKEADTKGTSEAAGETSVVWDVVVNGLKKEEKTKGATSVLYSTALSNKELSIMSELFDHVFAGEETSGLAMTYLTWRLSQSLQLQADLRAELRGLTPNMQLPLANGNAGERHIPDPKQLDSVPLLHAVLMETLRLHSPIPGPQPRQSPEHGSLIGPYAIPGGVRVAALAYTLHRDEEVFPNPEEWDPTRWLSSHATEEELKRRNRHFWAFSSGGRMCIGSNFAMHAMKLIIGMIYTNFTTHIVDDEGMENQADAYSGRPEKEKFYIRLENVL